VSFCPTIKNHFTTSTNFVSTQPEGLFLLYIT
jgi:hypothetical protein